MTEAWESARRVLMVHAHPDDETLATGVLIADLVERGVTVGLVTSSRGERGEIVEGVLDPGQVQRLSAIREGELQAAADRLGIAWRAYLGGPGARAPERPARRYEDSGMRWVRPGLAGPADDASEDALTAAPLEEVAADVAAAIAAFGADVVVTYDADGGYGHPDHVRCHEATAVACRTTGVPMYVVRREPGDDDPVVVDGRRHLALVQHALRAHRTQLTVVGSDVVHSGGQREPIVTRVSLRPW
ncbi:PIG-L family deacetylase [Cumulibacter manganitolerans]|uniref:PIG-L family deacetylase n=1 Tax=Cumulibacter manganitolerans TaxID=1884992 RepID=UPI0012957ADD|nr:PIG-L family deacetylase [Cumulibacter manganitolerans]